MTNETIARNYAATLLDLAQRHDGLEDFAGTVVHSHHYHSGAEWAGRKALVMGTGNSGHDAAQDLHANGADVSIIQRSSTLIVGLDAAQTVYDMYQEGPSLEDCDLIATASPYPVLVITPP